MNQKQSPVVVERTYPAKIEELWALWTTKEGFESWWGPEGFHVVVHALEARVGGRLHYDMIAHAPEQVAAMKSMGRPLSSPVHARFSELKPYERLVLTNTIDFLPEVEPYESTIVVDFVQSGSNARMVVTLEPMHDEQMTRMSRMGFASQLGKLDRRFGKVG
jgi:uncharacterized protein YndB with AHSA1/START domain